MEMLGPLAVILIQSGQTSIKQTQTSSLSLQKTIITKNKTKTLQYTNPTMTKSWSI